MDDGVRCSLKYVEREKHEDFISKNIYILILYLPLKLSYLLGQELAWIVPRRI